jgi:glycosyltransferase involved in cell wall biosynthesis
MINKNKKILLSAFGIHTGGGIVLLSALNNAVGSKLKFALLDVRTKGLVSNQINSEKVRYVRKSFFHRLLSIFYIARKADVDDVLICFNSLPPLTKNRCNVILFVQAPHFAGLHKKIKYNIITKIRIQIERVWFSAGIYNCDEIWVQTPSMAEALISVYPSIPIRVVPLVDDYLIKKISDCHELKISFHPPNQTTFFYPADAVGHKNHINLLKAWDLLWKSGCKPNLLLTLNPKQVQEITRRSGGNINWCSNVKNIGQITRSEVLVKLKQSSGLIFPSLAETFGLPLLEAKKLGIPIIASERDFVRDVCEPIETFDPTSPRSIARAVLRFMGENESDLQLVNASQFVQLLSTVDAKNKANPMLEKTQSSAD